MSTGSGRSSTWRSTVQKLQTSTICSISEMSSKYVRYDLILPSLKVGHSYARQLDVPSCCLYLGPLAKDQGSSVISFNQPFGIGLVAHFIQPTEENHDVRECDLTEGGEDR